VDGFFVIEALKRRMRSPISMTDKTSALLLAQNTSPLLIDKRCVVPTI
jgi:hypothetical protein